MKKDILKVQNMHCTGCAMTIKDELSEIPGVKNVEADLKTLLVTIEYTGDVDLHSRFVESLNELGYTVVE